MIGNRNVKCAACIMSQGNFVCGPVGTDAYTVHSFDWCASAVQANGAVDA